MQFFPGSVCRYPAAIRGSAALFFNTKLAYTNTQYGYLQVIIALGAMVGAFWWGWFSAKIKQSSNRWQPAAA
ncbi:MFS transporter [Syntrophomonas curvata]